MKPEETGSAFAARSRHHRSAVSNGSKIFSIAGADGRSSLSRRYRDIVAATTADLGGGDVLSEGQRQIIRRASALSIICESVEVDLVAYQAFDIANYLTAANALRRMVETLGLQRVVRDATPRLADYLEAKAEPAAEPVELGCRPEPNSA